VQVTCPRCSADLRPPSLWSDTWTCPLHGAVAPTYPPIRPSNLALHAAGKRSSVPLWLPWPLPAGWLFSGLRLAGDDHTGTVAAVVALSGPNPLPEADPLSMLEHTGADLLLAAEQPGIGLGAHLAGLTDVDPGAVIVESSRHRMADLKVVAAGQHTPLWTVEVPGECAAYVGEAAGVWLWVLLWPVHAAAVLLEPFELLDLRDPGLDLDLPYGAASPRLSPPRD